MNERRRRCSDAAATYWRKVIRGVDQAENPMMRRARQEETFPRGTWRFNPRGACFSAWSVTMIPFLCYVALVTPFEIAFISSDATLFYINLVVDIYFLVDFLVNFNLAFYDRERDRWVLHLWPIAVQYIKGLVLPGFDQLLSVRGGCDVAERRDVRRNLHVLERSPQVRVHGDPDGETLRLPRLLRMLRFGRVISRLASK